jgi:hypothetical protein
MTIGMPAILGSGSTRVKRVTHADRSEPQYPQPRTSGYEPMGTYTCRHPAPRRTAGISRLCVNVDHVTYPRCKAIACSAVGLLAGEHGVDGDGDLLETELHRQDIDG